jgi:hypothetical protein
MESVNLQLAANKQLPNVRWYMILLALVFCTFARIGVVIAYPLLVLLLFAGFRWRLHVDAKYIFILVIVCLALSFRDGFYLRYNLLSLFFFLPFLLLLFAAPPTPTRINYLRLLMNAVSVVVIVNDLIGLAQYIYRPNDDSFSGLYGTFTVSQNGLSIINSILFFYHANDFRYSKKSLPFFLAIFFLLSMVMGFYGAGLVVFIAATVFTYIKWRVGNIIKFVMIFGFGMMTVILLLWLISPATLEYNVNIIRLFIDAEGIEIPRKLIIFKSYFTAYTSNPPDFLFGSGPGTFNSRSAFMVGSTDYFNIDFIKSEKLPFYFENYAYTLWNASNTGPYDGFMNQPFSSLLALLGEYGLLVTASILFVAIRNYNFFTHRLMRRAKEENLHIELLVFKFTSFLMVFLFIIDNYMEYPEIIALILLMMKFSQQQLRRAIVD